VTRAARASLLLLAPLAPIAGCYSPSYPVGLACAPMTRACPPGQGCNVDGFCAPNPDGGGPTDAPPGDREAGGDAEAGPRCGNGTLDPGEECDVASDAAATCDPTCQISGLIGHWALGDEYTNNAVVPDLAIPDGVQNGTIVNHTGDIPAIQTVADRHGAPNQAIEILWDEPQSLSDRYGYVEFPDITSLPASVTLTVWIAEKDRNGFLFGMRHGPQLYLSSEALTAQVPASATNVTQIGGVPLTRGRWTFVAGVFTAPATAADTWTVSVYADGALAASGTPPNGNVPAIGDLLLGGLFNCSDNICDQGFVGSLDDARLYDRALSAEEIQALFQLP